MEKSRQSAYNKNRYRLNINRFLCNKYSMMRLRVLGRGVHGYGSVGKEICSKEEFLAWCYSEKSRPIFLKMYSDWKLSGFSRKLCPSIDRIDSSRGYSVDNLQWLTQSANSKKSNK